MKIDFSNLPGFNKLPEFLRKSPKLLIFIISGVVLIMGLLVFQGSKETRNIKKSLEISKDKEPKQDKDVGVLVGAVDTKSYVSRLEKQYYDISSKSDLLENEVKALEKNIDEIRKDQSGLSKIVMDFDKRFTQQLTQNTLVENRATLKPTLNLETAKVSELKPDSKGLSKKYVYLPLGSFVKCTLLTGVYAPSDQRNPLPVLISVDEAFYGPNNTKVPLKGAFAIGKAIGDVVSKRAIIQIVAFSTVLPDGKVFEYEGNLGYLADGDGQLGIQGELIYNTGKQLGLDFLSGFLSGGSEALSQAETSTVTGAYGQTSRNVTGDTGRYSMFSGLARSAEGMSQYYQKQLESLVPAVKIKTGTKITFVIQKGVEIEGLDSNSNSFGYID